jgi:hypothetical protein
MASVKVACLAASGGNILYGYAGLGPVVGFDNLGFDVKDATVNFDLAAVPFVAATGPRVALVCTGSIMLDQSWTKVLERKWPNVLSAFFHCHVELDAKGGVHEGMCLSYGFGESGYLKEKWDRDHWTLRLVESS